VRDAGGPFEKAQARLTPVIKAASTEQRTRTWRIEQAPVENIRDVGKGVRVEQAASAGQRGWATLAA
jgi:hypothetical protein